MGFSGGDKEVFVFLDALDLFQTVLTTQTHNNSRWETETKLPVSVFPTLSCGRRHLVANETQCFNKCFANICQWSYPSDHFICFKCPKEYWTASSKVAVVKTLYRWCNVDANSDVADILFISQLFSDWMLMNKDNSGSAMHQRGVQPFTPQTEQTLSTCCLNRLTFIALSTSFFAVLPHPDLKRQGKSVFRKKERKKIYMFLLSSLQPNHLTTSLVF